MPLISMDSGEATKVVCSRIQSLDPENASKIMDYFLLRYHGGKEMIRLAFGPEVLLHNLILQAKTHMGLVPNTPSTPSTTSSLLAFSPRSSPSNIFSSRVSSTNNGFDVAKSSSISLPFLTSNSTSSVTYASIVNGKSNNFKASTSLSSSALSLSDAFPCYNHIKDCSANSINSVEPVDGNQLHNQLSFLNDAKVDNLFDPRLELAVTPTTYSDNLLQMRSLLVPSMCFESEDLNSVLGWKPCLYFARGFCKNGTNCRFLHGVSNDGTVTPIVGSPCKLNDFEQCQEPFRSKVAAHQQKQVAASQFIAGASLPYNKSMNFLLQQQNDSRRSAAAAAALMMGDELHKFGRYRPDPNNFSPMGLEGVMSPVSRQIYLTFPADSTFREEDVSNYFSIYGPVQDVRIPYQQKRMFGFVAFVCPETVKIILAKGNPHFVCNSRVLVKPYKEKGKAADKKFELQQQQIERGEYSACSSPTYIDCREPFDLQLGVSMFYNDHQEMLLRRKLEQQVELQEKMLMNLQLLDFKRQNQLRYLHGFTTCSPISSPSLPGISTNDSFVLPYDGINQEVLEDYPHQVFPGKAADASQHLNSSYNHNSGSINSCLKEEKSKTEESDLLESLEVMLPDSLFTSPKKSAGDHLTAFSSASLEVDERDTRSSTSSSNDNLLTPSTSRNMASLKSCFLQMPRLSSGEGTIGI